MSRVKYWRITNDIYLLDYVSADEKIIELEKRISFLENQVGSLLSVIKFKQEKTNEKDNKIEQ